MVAGTVCNLLSLFESGVSDDLNGPAYAPLAVDHLAAFFGPHSGTEPDVAGPLDLAGLMRVMHRTFPSSLFG
jgi:hypothetical protein